MQYREGGQSGQASSKGIHAGVLIQLGRLHLQQRQRRSTQSSRRSVEPQAPGGITTRLGTQRHVHFETKTAFEPSRHHCFYGGLAGIRLQTASWRSTSRGLHKETR